MKKLFLLLAILATASYSFSQINTDDDVLTEEYKTRLWQGEQLAFKTITKGFSDWIVTSRQIEGITCFINVEPAGNRSTKADRTDYDRVIGEALRLIKLRRVDIAGLLSVGTNRPALEFYFLKDEGGNYTQQTSWWWERWSITDFKLFGSQSFTHKENFAPARRIVVKGDLHKYQDDNILIRGIVHSMGHILHEISLGDKSYWSEQSLYNSEERALQPPRPGRVFWRTWESLSGQVNNHATHNRSEFVAELFTCVCLGKEVEVLKDRNRAAAVIERYNFYRAPAMQFSLQ